MTKREKYARAWKRVPRPIRKTLVLMVGSAVIVVGLVMIVTPGPGWAALLLGFAILATEFAFAEKVRDWMFGILKKSMAHGKRVLGKVLKRSDTRPGERERD
jgi:uncharacterized protein (TIGR02611 family)